MGDIVALALLCNGQTVPTKLTFGAVCLAQLPFRPKR
jgi:hypothetical protein